MRVLGSIPAPQRLDEPDNLASLLKAGVNERQIHQMREQWVCGNKDMAAWQQNPKHPLSKRRKKLPQAFPIFISKDGKARKRVPFAAVERWGNTPNTTFSAS
jgi:hypothetical protein